MRWKDKPPTQIGDTRTRLVYAWKRTRVNNYVVWLEHYYVTEEYVNVSQEDFMYGYHPRPGTQWVETGRDVADWYI